MKNLFETFKIKKLANGGPISPDDINNLFDEEGFQFTPYSGQDANLNNLLIELFGTNYEQAFPYLSEYDTTSEELAGLQREQSEYESGLGLSSGIATAQGQVGSNLTNLYAQGRTGQQGFGGTTLPGMIKRNLNIGYKNLRSGLQDEYDTSMTDAALTEASAIQSSRDRYQSDITNMLTTLQDIIEYGEGETPSIEDELLDESVVIPGGGTGSPNLGGGNFGPEDCPEDYHWDELMQSCIPNPVPFN